MKKTELLEFNTNGKKIKLSFLISEYESNGNIALVAVDDNGSTYGTISVNIDGALLSDEGKDHICADVNNIDKSIIDSLCEYGILFDLCRTVNCGFVDYPVYIVDTDKFK